MERREFLRSLCAVCAVATSAGSGMALSGCASTKIVHSTAEGGSLRISTREFDSTEFLIVRSSQLENDILLVRRSETNYSAVEMICTHQNNPLMASATGLHCPSHGSAFDFDGTVLRGPASTPLKNYRTTVSENTVHIALSA